LGLREGFIGDIREFADPELDELIDLLNVSRGSYQGPIFEVAQGISVGEPVVPAINRKFKKRYAVQDPLELLVYTGASPLFPENAWEPQLRACLSGKCCLKPFRKIWVLDLGKRNIPFVIEAI
jgi:hypothetical protein